MTIIAYLIGIISGVAATVQASFNGEIRRRFRSPYITAAINFVVALAIIAAVLLVTERSLALPVSDILKYPPWIWTGGVCGATIVMAGILCLPVLGSAQNMMILCFGQIMAGLLIDHYGIFDAPVTKMTLMRALGAVLEIAGIAFISAEKTGNGGRGLNGRTLLFIVFDILAGFAAAAQVAINGTMAVVAGSPVRSTLISMCGALLTMTVICCLLSVFGGRTAVFDEKNPPAGRVRFTPFFLTGGLMALVVVGGNAITGPVLGTGMVTMMNLFGMMAAGLAIDATGFLGIEVKPVTKPKLLGMAMMLAGTALISF
jgi:transporter family-2 protein